MSVTDFECAIAKSQIGRYIAGDNLAPEIARQLEGHIDNCPRCRQLLEEKKNSLEAIIMSGENAELNITTEPIAMQAGSTTKPDFMEVLANSARQSLREKLKESAKIQTGSIEVPTVTPAFAYKDAPEIETVHLQIESPEPQTKKRGLSLSSFALFRDVPDGETKPALSAENIRSAKAVFRDNNATMVKPALYLAGLCCVVGAMSYVLRDPTSLFGGKAAGKTALMSSTKTGTQAQKFTKKSTKKIAKVLPHKPTQLTDQGIDAHSFTNEPAPQPKPIVKPKAKAKAKAKPKVAPKRKISKPKSLEEGMEKSAGSKKVHRTPTAQTPRKPKAQRFSTQDSPKVKSRRRLGSTEKPKAQRFSTQDSPKVKSRRRPGLTEKPKAQRFSTQDSPKAKPLHKPKVTQKAKAKAPKSSTIENDVKLYTEPTPKRKLDTSGENKS